MNLKKGTVLVNNLRFIENTNTILILAPDAENSILNISRNIRNKDNSHELL